MSAASTLGAPASDAIEPGHILIRGEQWPTGPVVAERLGISERLLSTWDDNCPCLGTGLNPELVTSPTTGHHQKAYNPSVVGEVKRKLAEIAKGDWLNPVPITLESGVEIPAGTLWWSLAKSVRQYWKVWKAGSEWRRVRLRELMRSGRIAGKRFAFVPGTSPGTSSYWCVADDVKSHIAEITRRRREVRRNGVAKTAVPKPIEAFDGLLPGAPRRFGMRRAVKELNRMLSQAKASSRLTRVALQRYGAALPGYLARLFEDGKLPTELRQVPGSRSEVATVTEDDLSTLARGIISVEQSFAARGNRLTAEQLCDRFGVSRLEDRVATTQLLRTQPLGQVLLKPPGSKQPGWFFDPADVERWLAGRNLAELALLHRDELLLSGAFGKAVLDVVDDAWKTLPEIRENTPGRRRSSRMYRLVLQAGTRQGLIEHEGPESRGRLHRWRRVAQGDATNGGQFPESKKRRGPEKSLSTKEFEDACWRAYTQAKATKKKMVIAASELKQLYPRRKITARTLAIYGKRSSDRDPAARPWPTNG